jgi:hypothetical protein
LVDADLGRRFRANQGWHLPKRVHGWHVQKAGARLAPIEAHAWFRDDAGERPWHRSTSKTIRRNMRAIAVIGIALLLNPILDLGEHTAWR